MLNGLAGEGTIDAIVGKGRDSLGDVGNGAGGQSLLVIDKTPYGLKRTVLEAVNFVPLKSGIA